MSSLTFNGAEGANSMNVPVATYLSISSVFVLQFGPHSPLCRSDKTSPMQ
jgi:hypothetical protein